MLGRLIIPFICICPLLTTLDDARSRSLGTCRGCTSESSEWMLSLSITLSLRSRVRERAESERNRIVIPDPAIGLALPLALTGKLPCMANNALSSLYEEGSLGSGITQEIWPVNLFT